MSPKSVDLEDAIAELKSEVPGPDVQRRAILAISPRKRTTQVLRYTLMGVASAAIAFILWPRESMGSAWARTLQNTINANNVHRRMIGKNGVVLEEMWQSDHKHGFCIRNPDGSLALEQFTDGVRRYSFNNGTNRKKLPNTRMTAHVGTMKHEDGVFYLATETLQLILEGRGTSVLSRKVIDTPDGPREQYEISFVHFVWTGKAYKDLGKDVGFVEVEPASGRVRKYMAADRSVTTYIDYPETMDPSIFEPRPHLAKDVELHDIDVERKEVADSLERGLGAKGGVNLRFLGLDDGGNLWVLWTGSPVSGKAMKPFEIVGHRVGHPFGMRAFTESYPLERMASPAPSIHVRLQGMALPVLDKLGNWVTIRVPKDGKWVEFKDVPIRRFSDIYSLNHELGIRP